MRDITDVSFVNTPKLLKPLNNLLVGHLTNMKGKKTKAATPWTWGPEQQEAFDLIIEKLTSPPVLADAYYSKEFILNIDASGDGLGVVLYQETDGIEHVIAFASRGLRANECNYPAHMGWSGGAMVLGKLPVPGRPTILITVGQGPIALAVGAGGGGLDIFYSHHLSFLLFLPLFGRRSDID